MGDAPRGFGTYSQQNSKSKILIMQLVKLSNIRTTNGIAI